MRLPLHRGARFVVDTQRLWHVVVHNGDAPRFALITSFESGPALERVDRVAAPAGRRLSGFDPRGRLAGSAARARLVSASRRPCSAWLVLARSPVAGCGQPSSPRWPQRSWRGSAIVDSMTVVGSSCWQRSRRRTRRAGRRADPAARRPSGRVTAEGDATASTRRAAELNGDDRTRSSRKHVIVRLPRNASPRSAASVTTRTARAADAEGRLEEERRRADDAAVGEPARCRRCCGSSKWRAASAPGATAWPSAPTSESPLADQRSAARRRLAGRARRRPRRGRRDRRPRRRHPADRHRRRIADDAACRPGAAGRVLSRRASRRRCASASTGATSSSPSTPSMPTTRRWQAAAATRLAGVGRHRRRRANPRCDCISSKLSLTTQVF